MANSTECYGWKQLFALILPLLWTIPCLSQIDTSIENPMWNQRPAYRVLGEFEPQDAILLGANELVETNADLFVQLVKHLRGKIEIVLMVCDVEQAELAKEILRESGLPVQSLRVLELSHDTMWARDYGPIVVMSEQNEAIFVDAFYSTERVADDETPTSLAQLMGKATIELPLRIDGGNLLFNGSGIAVTTRCFWDENLDSDLDESSIMDALSDVFGINQLVTLEPLFEEPTGHVDMFATFISPNTVVVGRYDPEIDPINAAVLDRNAVALANVVLPDGPLKVIRIPMPERTGETWRTYTNVIYANGVLLVPRYPDVDEPELEEALKLYKNLLPDWQVIAVDCSRLITSCGALHCVSMNLARVGRLPKFAPPRTHFIDYQGTFELHQDDRRPTSDQFPATDSTLQRSVTQPSVFRWEASELGKSQLNSAYELTP